SDLHRLAKARKLRELLKEEIHKEKRLKKSKLRSKEFSLDPAKMTMRDLIHYLPESNPMTSCLEAAAPEDENVISPLPESQREEEEEAAADGDEEEALLVPQVKVAEDGTLIIDESSLTVEVQRAKGPNLIQDRDPIFERGSTTTYSSFRKGNYSKPWSTEETDMFFLAVSMVGTDFTMICQLFPHRARSEIKNKFKKEERQNSWRIDKAFRERRKLDIEYFSKLLEMILEVQKNRKKHKSLAEKNEPKKKRRRAKGKKAQQRLSDVEEEAEDEIPELEDDVEEVREEENVDLCRESQAPVSQPKKQRKRRRQQDATTDAP
uniref:Zgc:162472 n=1 Tax=Tetraodon nigroviridis TaxID=99883 RepID=H3D7F9_TETNG